MNSQEQVFKQTGIVTKRYMDKISPYEMIVESITLQNREIYELQKKYLEMSALVEKLPPVNPEDF